MLDRESELEAIENALDEAFDGGGRLVLIEGPGGIGKTRLLERALAMARERRCLALRATGDELEGQLAHSITLQLLSCARDTDVEIEPSDVFTAAGPAENESEAFHRLQWWLTSLATDRPILVAVDDAHWADLDSLRFMRFLARRLENTSITLLIASRPASDDGRRALLAGLQDSASVALRPSSLSESALRSIVADRLGSEPDAEFLTAFGGATGGNPFLVRELLTELGRSGVAPVAAEAARVKHVTPASVSRMVLLRLVPMPESARAMARAIAILGEHATLAAAALVAEVETEEAAATWERLSDDGILARKEPPRFVHPLLRGAVLDDLGAPSRGALHDRAAEVLRTSGAPSAAIAVHLLEGVRRDRPWAVDVLIETARTAEAAGALQASIAYLRRALEEPSAQSGRRDILRELCRARARAFDPDVADDYPEVLNGASTHEERAEIMSEWAFARVVRGQASEARELLRTAQGELDDPDSELGLRLQAEAAAAAWFAPASWGEAAEHILPLSSLPGDTPGRRLLLANVAYASVMKGSDAPAVAGIAERAWGEGKLLTDQGANAPSIYYAVFALIASDALDLADAVLESALEQARNRGSVFAFSIASAMRSFVAYRRGDVIAAEGEARAAVEAAALNIGAMPNAVAYLADALIERGQLDAASAALAEVVVGDEILRGNLDQAILGARGRLRLAAGQLSEACEDFRELGERFARWGTDHPAWTNYRALMAACLSGLGRREEALAAAAQDLELARRWGTARAVGLALRARGLALGGDDGVATLREAATVLGESPARLEYARVLIDLGAALRRGNTRAAAREPLREAMDLCGRLGAVTLGDRARDELRATGARPRRVLLTGVDALTPSELRIGRMAASGLSNPEIAQALFVTRKNVEARLGNAYRKLEINSRDQLAAALGDGARREHGADLARE